MALKSMRRICTYGSSFRMHLYTAMASPYINFRASSRLYFGPCAPLTLLSVLMSC